MKKSDFPSELDQLHNMYEKRPARRTMAQSHVDDDAYMRQWDATFKSLGGKEPEEPSFSKERSTVDLSGGSICNLPTEIYGNWRISPVEPEGQLVELSDQPILAMSVFGDEAVVACCDHSLYGVSVSKHKKNRTLYSKRFGHSEWVTCLCHTCDGHVISGGLDSKLCHWDLHGTRCVDLLGHRGSISGIKAHVSEPIAVTGSYDKTLRIWSTGARPRELSCLKGHSAPVLKLDFNTTGLLCSGGRDGRALLWDVASHQPSARLRGHSGHVTAVRGYNGDLMMEGVSNVFFTGDQGGVIRVWDTREASCTVAVPAHANEEGVGAVGEIKVCDFGGARPPVVVSCGADNRVAVLDPRKGFAPLYTFEEHTDFVYSLEVSANGLALSGGGNGLLLVHDLVRGELVHGMGANKAAVRCIGMHQSNLIVSGDDGNVLIYSFPRGGRY